jgi:hypothetical protein
MSKSSRRPSPIRVRVCLGLLDQSAIKWTPRVWVWVLLRLFFPLIVAVFWFVRPKLRVLNYSSAIVTSIELHFILFLLVFFNSQQGLAFVARSTRL